MNSRALSRAMATALRPDPPGWGLVLDAQGWAPLADVAAVFQVTVDDVRIAAALPGVPRYEIEGGRIRSRDRLPPEVEHPVGVPPERLFHGTTVQAVAGGLADGLRPGPGPGPFRRYVHLSGDYPRTHQSASQWTGSPIVFVVSARAAHEDGVVFHDAGNGLWLTRHVPAKYVRLENS